MYDQEQERTAVVEIHEADTREVFDLVVEPNLNPIDLFELTLPRPPQGSWREKFDIRADVRFAQMILKFDNILVRVGTRAARLSSACDGCSLLAHSLYGLNPLPSRNVVAVQEKQTREIAASGAAQIQAKIGVLQGVDGGASLDAKASGETAHRVEKQASREESVLRVIPRPHGSWDLTEPNAREGCLDGDYLTSRGQYLDVPSNDPVDAPLATVQANDGASEIAIELAIEIQPKDLVFHRVMVQGEHRAPKTWFQRERINVELIARRLIELTQNNKLPPSEVRITLGRTTLRGRRRPKFVRAE
ncbi:hypothetical protein [Bradyrhizobium cenepequi]|uniref:hypothetical protein n=1 Tax=Bradyrhizobium cenepequi TaxID=2821403 RepID=UPI001CE2F682|nr:hypothetical protein [Bradyrhizobium cenepequi]MCA6109013.1 hypothetical protein [Bradyrhizobium cenepequi]